MRFHFFFASKGLHGHLVGYTNVGGIKVQEGNRKGDLSILVSILVLVYYYMY